jgi:hypothetical protein
MAAATVRLYVATGAGPTLANGEAGFCFSREDTVSGTTPVPVPSTTGTNYSWLKWILLNVTVAGTTSITNRRVQLSTTETAGLAIFFRGTATYAQATSGNMPPASALNGPAIPTTFARANSTQQVYDAASVATSGTGRNGQYCELVAAVDSTFAGADGTAIPMPDIRLVYDES